MYNSPCILFGYAFVLDFDYYTHWTCNESKCWHKRLFVAVKESCDDYIMVFSFSVIFEVSISLTFKSSCITDLDIFLYHWPWYIPISLTLVSSTLVSSYTTDLGIFLYHWTKIPLINCWVGYFFPSILFSQLSPDLVSW